MTTSRTPDLPPPDDELVRDVDDVAKRHQRRAQHTESVLAWHRELGTDPREALTRTREELDAREQEEARARLEAARAAVIAAAPATRIFPTLADDEEDGA